MATDGDVVCPVKLVKRADLPCRAGGGRRAGIGDVDYLDAVVVITCDQRVWAAAYHLCGNVSCPVKLVKRVAVRVSASPSDIDDCRP